MEGIDVIHVSGEKKKSQIQPSLTVGSVMVDSLRLHGRILE